MTPHQHPPIITQKLQLTFKLLLLENARNKLEQDLGNVIDKAYNDIQGFLNSSCSTSVFGELTKTLDMKYQAINKISVLLRNLTLEPRSWVQSTGKNGMRSKQLQPLRKDKRILISDVLKFGPMLQNSLMASSIAKAVQVLGATHPLQQLKHSLNSQPTIVQEDDLICSIQSSHNSAVVTTRCHLKVEEKETEVVFEEKCQADAVIRPPATIQSPHINAEKREPPLLLPPIKAAFPLMSNPTPMTITPLISWGCEDGVQVQHQKQTSSQLLHFLREKAQTIGALEVTIMERSKSSPYTSSLSQSASPTRQPQSCQLEYVKNAPAPQTLFEDTENQAPVFRIKRVESSGSLTYTCVIATKTELWDMGDIFTEVGKGSADNSPSENKDGQNRTDRVEENTAAIQHDGSIRQCTNPENENNSSGSETPEIYAVNIPKFQIRKFEETEVVVSHIISPSNFSIQHADSIVKLRAFVTNSCKASSSYAEQNCIPDIGTQVMGWFPKQEQWCRAQVTKICGVSGDDNTVDGAEGETSIKVEVRRLDYGDTVCLSLRNIKEMTPELASLPLQSLHVSLANVIPINGSNWSEEAVSWFRAMVYNRTLYARLFPQGTNVTVELFLEKGKLGAMRRGASLSLRLAQNGHAKHSKLINSGLMKRSTAWLKMEKQDSAWEKYLISCHTQRSK